MSFLVKNISVVDPHWFQCGFRSSTGFRALMTKNLKNLQLEKVIFFWSKIAIYLFLDLRKECPSYRKMIYPSKETIWHLKTWNFFAFVGPFCPPGSGSSRPKCMYIRSHKTDKYDACLIDYLWHASGTCSWILDRSTPLRTECCAWSSSWTARRSNGRIRTLGSSIGNIWGFPLNNVIRKCVLFRCA